MSSTLMAELYTWRPRKMNGQQINEARARLAEGEPVGTVARAYNVDRKTLRTNLKR